MTRGERLGWSASMLAGFGKCSDRGVEAIQHRARAEGLPIVSVHRPAGAMQSRQSCEFSAAPAQSPVEILPGRRLPFARLLREEAGAQASSPRWRLGPDLGCSVDGRPDAHARHVRRARGRAARLIVQGGRCVKDTLPRPCLMRAGLLDRRVVRLRPVVGTVERSSFGFIAHGRTWWCSGTNRNLSRQQQRLRTSCCAWRGRTLLFHRVGQSDASLLLLTLAKLKFRRRWWAGGPATGSEYRAS